MKIRNGFVSNSSSSSYVVCLPTGFKFDSKIASAKIKRDGYYDDEDEITMMIDKMKDHMADLKEGVSVYQYEAENDSFYYAAEYLEKFIVMELNAQPDNGVIAPLNLRKLRDILEDENL